MIKTNDEVVLVIQRNQALKCAFLLFYDLEIRYNICESNDIIFVLYLGSDL